jgi:hypothetical protein
MTNIPTAENRNVVIEDTNLSRAWGRAILKSLSPGTERIAPLIICLSGFDQDGLIEEDDDIRHHVDVMLTESKEQSVENVAFTIFPQKYWKLSGGDRGAMFRDFARDWPRIQKMSKLNKRGNYFQRLTMYEGTEGPINQLEFIISQHVRYRDEHGMHVRPSMLQAATFDPRHDHVGSIMLGFPCLQHVSFFPTSGGLLASAFYASQYLFKKAYGNYLGLARLSAFMAHEMDLPLVGLTVYVGAADLDIGKDKLRKSDLVKSIVRLVDACH